MLICLVLCVAAIFPTAFSEAPEARNVQSLVDRNNDNGQMMSAHFAALRSPLRFQKYESGESPAITDDRAPSLSDIYIALWSKSPYALLADSDDAPLRQAGLVPRSLDQIGGGHLLRREAILDSIGGGHLLKRDNGFRALDPIGGGHLLKRNFELRQLDAIGGGHLLKRALDAIGGGNLLKRYALDSIGGGNLLKREALDAIGGGNLLKREFDRRQLDAIGGGHLLKRSVKYNGKEENSDVNEAALV